MNTCPVYRRSGGHSYHNTVPGPIGSILAPAHDADAHASLPFACSLCGSCTDVCPVKIDLHSQLYTWRNKLALKGLLPRSKRWAMHIAGRVLGSRRLFTGSGRLARFWLPRLPRWMAYHRLNVWGREREMPLMPARSFREEYRRREGREGGNRKSDFGRGSSE